MLPSLTRIWVGRCVLAPTVQLSAPSPHRHYPASTVICADPTPNMPFCGILLYIGLIAHTPAPVGRSRRAYWVSREPKRLRLIMRSRSVAKPLALCCGLRPRWNHITSYCPRDPCYIPRPDDPTNGGVNTAFRHTENVGFQNHQNFGAHNQHPSLRPGIPSPQLHISLLPGRVWGSVLRWWLTFPQAGFSPAGEYGFISAHLFSVV